jgi:hypothetical protein
MTVSLPVRVRARGGWVGAYGCLCCHSHALYKLPRAFYGWPMCCVLPRFLCTQVGGYRIAAGSHITIALDLLHAHDLLLQQQLQHGSTGGGDDHGLSDGAGSLHAPACDTPHGTAETVAADEGVRPEQAALPAGLRSDAMLSDFRPERWLVSHSSGKAAGLAANRGQVAATSAARPHQQLPLRVFSYGGHACLVSERVLFSEKAATLAHRLSVISWIRRCVAAASFVGKSSL